ncbi:hypothetical protein AWL63_09420 [Sphingomonas panacis]|uniref:Uncharacterized protein n=2 Tax=Sphingomonas panacis TaxID=1560345 RepID=A0A1B3Z9P6_9SPHN|nr:hypothetical protein AWL63_09420 [Sphingomonas panacis]
MDDSELWMMVGASTAFGVLASAVVLFWFFRGQRRRLAVPPTTGADGMTSFPVRGISTQSRLIVGGSHNSINPLFAIGPGGIDLRVLRHQHLAFSDIEQADVRNTLVGQMLVLKHVDGRKYAIRFGTADHIGRVLTRIPAYTVRLTEAATRLRDAAATGTSR